MFGDIAKIAIRAATVALVIGVIIGLFATIQVPAVDFSTMTNPMNTAWAVAQHWGGPAMTTLLDIALNLIKLELAAAGIWLVLIGYMWIFRINE